MRYFVVPLLVILVGISAGYAYFTADTTVIEVTDKQTKLNCDGEGSCKDKYLIFTAQNDVFQNVDTWWYLKFNSSTVYGTLKIGEKYEVDHYGWRVPFFSWYPNITDVRAIE